jgi:MarR family transcriptional regulator, lower aerobic nicotinate degradation pathway regulator
MHKISTSAESPRQREDYKLENQVGFMLRLAYQRATANLIGRIGEFDLTPPQFAALAKLYEEGSLSQNRLGRFIAMEPANIRDVVQRLKKRGLIATKAAEHDKRLIILQLTPVGLDLVEPLLQLDTEATAQTLAPLEPHERECLANFLRRISDG